MSGIQAKAVLKYAIMPGIVPRLHRLFASGFGYTAFLMAYIYNMVRLIPGNHPYLKAGNIGKFGLRHVIAAAAANLVIKKQNIDQIVIFTLLLTGVVLLGLMIAGTIISFVFGYAFAQNPPVGSVASMFVTREPKNDIAFMLLDQVFGVPNFFNSCVATQTACYPGHTPGAFPWPFHQALQQMFRFYSSGILFIGMLIFLYYVVVIVVETATSGSPFGQRFKNMWVPVRLVVAIGLLIPLAHGYNSAQYITFGAAKFGSSFATNTWLLYNKALAGAGMGQGQDNPTGEKGTLVGLPKSPDMSSIAQMMSVVHTCAFSYWYEDSIVTKKTRENMPNDEVQYKDDYRIKNKIKPYMVKNVQSWMKAPLFKDTTAVTRIFGLDTTASSGTTTYQKAMGFYGRGDIIIRFGKLNDKDSDENIDPGENVDPLCGDIRIKITDARLPGDPGLPTTGPVPGTIQMQEFYFNLIRDLWFDYSKARNYLDFAGRSYLLTVSSNKDNNDPCSMGCTPQNPHLPSCTAGGGGTPPCRTQKEIPAAWKQNATNELQIEFDSKLKSVWANYNANNTDINMTPEILKHGWGGAGIWYNKIAQMNGAFSSAVINIPQMSSYPLVMENVRENRKKTESDNNVIRQFDPQTSTGKPIQFSSEAGPNAFPIATGLYNVHHYWNKEPANMASTEKDATTGAVETAMNFMLGTKGLFAMTGENAHIHPLAQLVSLGKSLVDNAVGAVAGSTLLSAGGGFLKAMGMSSGQFEQAASGLIMSTAFIGLTVGVVLYYVLPFLPFLFFYFAVATWIKAIFEAMVGVPLWALAHIRTDGEGLPGDAASNGYFIILEIFLRPVMTVIAMIGALIIFTAQVRILNFIWLLVTDNAGGFDGDVNITFIGGLNFKRTIIDQFFFTVLYAIVVYMLAMASFKLIDRIPDDILRWMGSQASGFSDINQDQEAISQISGKVTGAGISIGQSVTGGIQELGGRLGGAAGQALNGFVGPPAPPGK